MKRKTWRQLSERAFQKKVESEELLDQAVQMLMRDKGFSEEAVENFSACYAGGNETVIHFCGEGEFADLDIKVAFGMTKDEIISRLERYLTDSSKEIMNREKQGNTNSV